MFLRIKARDNTGSLVYMDLTDWTPKAQVRSDPTSTTVLIEFVCTKTDQTAIPGGVLVHADPALTTGIAVDNAMWDFQISKSTTDRKTVLAGNVTFSGEITQ